MGWFRNHAGRAPEAAPWDGPFAPPAPTGPAKFDPMVKTAAQLVDHHDLSPAPVPAAAAAAA